MPNPIRNQVGTRLRSFGLVRSKAAPMSGSAGNMMSSASASTAMSAATSATNSLRGRDHPRAILISLVGTNVGRLDWMVRKAIHMANE
jgi:hypothetical protein